MSLEASIAALTQQAGLLMDLPEQVSTAAQTQIAALGTAYQGFLAALSVTAYVDQVNGLDTNAGTINAPFRSIEKALSLTPRGGRCLVVMKADYTISNANIAVGGKHLILASDSAVKRNLYFERFLMNDLTPVLRAVRGFKLAGGSLSIIGLTINVPVIDGSWGTYAAANAHMIGVADTNSWRPVDLTVYNCNVVIPASPMCCLVESTVLLDLLWSGNTLTGAITSINGRLLADQGNTAGVATTTLPWLRTNLATV